MSSHIYLKDFAQSTMMGLRSSANPARVHAERLLDAGSEVTFDFSGLSATQSFIDELVGALVIRRGPSILEKIVFKGCSADIRAILRFVTADRSMQFERNQNKHACGRNIASSSSVHREVVAA